MGPKYVFKMRNDIIVCVGDVAKCLGGTIQIPGILKIPGILDKSQLDHYEY